MSASADHLDASAAPVVLTADVIDPGFLPLTGAPATTVLEASAGTGKTWTIAALATRAVARDAVPVDRIMMVTFGRNATRELRSRIFQRLRSSAEALAAQLDRGEQPIDDFDQLLADCGPDELARRVERLNRAVADIDLATIATTHQFCHRMLGELGLLVDHDPTSRQVDDLRPLWDEVITDRYLARYRDCEQPPPWWDHQRLAEAALRHPTLAVVPLDVDGATAERVSWCADVRVETERRKRLRGVHDFDDLVGRIKAALTDPETGELAAEVLSQRFPIVLVDEFQDTDPDQWAIVERAFHGRSHLVLIGDPKQAIYAFRGADVQAYLRALAVADHRYTLGTNHRSDPGVVQGLTHLFGGAALGDPQITVHTVRADHEVARISSDQGSYDWSTPVVVRVVPAEDEQDSSTAATIAGDVATTIASMLADDALLTDAGRQRALRAADIAVLVRTNRFGQRVHDALTAAGIAATFPGGQSVFASRAARDWALLLTALADPSPQATTRAALTSLLGLDAFSLAAADAEVRGELSKWVRQLRLLLIDRGVASVFETACELTGLHRRVLAQSDGERLLTDLRHVSELLHERQARLGLTPGALAAWLSEQLQTETDAGDERTRRLETDVDAVQILTIHRAKGLQFPVVLVPEATTAWNDARTPPAFLRHDSSVATGKTQRVLDVGGGDDVDDRLADSRREDQDEQLRLFYVAVTRAMSHVVAWWAGSDATTAKRLALHRLLFGKATPLADAAIAAPAGRFHGSTPEDMPDGDDPFSLAWVDGSLVRVSVINACEPAPVSTPALSRPMMQVRRWSRAVDQTWRRTSYTGLTADIHATAEPGASAGAAAPGLDSEAAGSASDEPDLTADDGSLDAGWDTAVPAAAPTPLAHADDPDQALAPLPGGVAFGSLVHAVLEQVDFTDDDLPAALRGVSAPIVEAAHLTGVTLDAVVTGLHQVLDTPLGSLTGNRSLRSFALPDRLSELDFDVAMGREATGGPRTVADLAELFTDSALVPASDPLAGYGDHLAASLAAAKTLNGILTGSIDAVLRVAPDERGRDQPRFVVLDYKTNRVPTPLGEPLRARHYTAQAMTQAMIEAHYPLQALLYSVALHRFLTWRLPGYQPGIHLGGVGYLFVRGMAGTTRQPVDGQAMPRGVFTWHPTSSLVMAASAVLDGSTAGGGEGR